MDIEAKARAAMQALYEKMAAQGVVTTMMFDFGIPEVVKQFKAELHLAEKLAESRLETLRGIARLNATDPSVAREYAWQKYEEFLDDPVKVSQVRDFLKSIYEGYGNRIPSDLSRAVEYLEVCLVTLRSIRCAFCGHKTDAATPNAIVEHIADCEKHPLNTAAKVNAVLASMLEEAFQALESPTCARPEGETHDDDPPTLAQRIRATRREGKLRFMEIREALSGFRKAEDADALYYICVRIDEAVAKADFFVPSNP